MPNYRCFVGIDIAATTAVAVWGSSPDALTAPLTFQQNDEGVSHLVQRLNSLVCDPAEVLVVMEVTGNYWQLFAFGLHHAGFAVAVLNPAQAHFFAQAKLKKVKSDPVDARLLAELGITLRPDPWTPPAAIYERLHQLLLHRDALIEMRVREENRLHALKFRVHVEPLVQTALEAHIACLKAQLHQVEREITLTLRDEALADSARRLQSIPGVGEITAAWLLTSTLNFQFSETPEQVVSYAGLAPYERRSGTSLRSHSSVGGGGNQRLRVAVYMAAVAAVRWNPIIREFYRRLRAKGKAAKVAMCAAARKLLTIAWAIVTKQRMFDPDFDRKATLAHQRA